MSRDWLEEHQIAFYFAAVVAAAIAGLSSAQFTGLTAMAITPAGVSESFGYSYMPDLGSTFEWKASLSIDGQDVAFCPRSGQYLFFSRP